MTCNSEPAYKRLLNACALLAILNPTALLAQVGTDLDCVIEASEVAEVASSVRGVMWVVNVERGDWVKEGQVVAEIENSVEEATVNLARVRAKSEYEIQAREARVDLADKQVRRIRDLQSTKVIAMQALDEAETEMTVAQIALNQANEDHRIAVLELERVERMLELRTIRSPVSGVVVKIYTSASEIVFDQPIMQIAQIDPLYVEAIVPVALFGSISEGMVSQVFPEEPIGGEVVATVSLVERIIDASSGTFGVRLILPNPDRKLPAGLRCRVRFPN